MSRRKVLVGAMILSAFCGGLWWLSRPGGGERPEVVEKVESLEVVESVDSVESIEQVESVDKVESVESIESIEQVEKGESPVQYKMPDPAVPRIRQAATANRLFVAPETGRAVEDSFAATQTPSARGTVPYVLVPTTEFDDVHVARLDALGVRRLGYFPPNGILVELTEDQFKAVSDEPMFSLVGEWRAEDKIDPFMARHIGEGGREAIVITCDAADTAALAKIVADAGGRVTANVTEDTGCLKVDFADGKDVLASLAAHGEVRWIEPYVQPHVANYQAVQPSHMNVTPVWNTHGLTGTNQVVAVLDSGLDKGDMDDVLDDFKGRILALYDYSGTGMGCQDYSGHGTHVAGSLFGSGVLSPNRNYRGVAYEAKAVVCGGGVGSGNGLYFGDYSLKQRLYTTGMDTYGYRIHSDSWGSTTNGTYGIDSRVADQTAESYPNLLISTANGNAGASTFPTSNSPATGKNVLAVGSCGSSRDYQDPNSRSVFSSYGTVDGRYKPDLMAVGFSVISDLSRLFSHDPINSGDLIHYYKNQGTSMATPLASGCATLVRQWLVEQRNMSEPSSALIKAILTGGANGSRPTVQQGWGRINLEQSLFPTNGVVYLKDDITLNAKSQCVASFTATNSAPMRVQLAWIDPAAAYEASLALVNDHDLIVKDVQTGQTWYGNDFDNTKVYDRLNNIEGVRIPFTTVGHEYRVYIMGKTTRATGVSRPALYVVAAARENEVTDTEESDGAADEFGIVPYHWYTFDSDMSSQGVDECLSGGENAYADYATNNVAAQSGRALVTLDGKLHPYGTMTSSAAFTLMASLRSVETANAVLLSIGNVSGNGITLVANGPDKVKLLGRSVTYGQLSTQTREITVEKATTRYHHYALTYRNGSYQLYVDGVAAGAAVGLTQSTRGVQLGGQLGGVGNLGVTRASGVCIDDFRVYTNALDAATVAGYAAHFPPWPGAGEPDEAGIVPAHWYKFDGTTESIGASPCFASSMDGAGFMATQDGQALVTDASVIPTGTMTNSETFAVAFSLKSVTTADAALFSIGDLTSNGIIITANGPNSIRFDLHDGNKAVNPFPIDVQNAASSFHHYVINFYRLANGNYQYKFYVDGVVAQTPNKNSPGQMTDVKFTRSQANRSIKLGGITGGNGNLGVTTATGVAIDDFRVYATSLTEDQIASYASHFPVWNPHAPETGSIPAWNGVTFDYVFRGVTNGDWDTLSNWYSNTFEVTKSATPWTTNWPSAYSGNVVPGAPNSNVWNPTLLDGDLMSSAVPVNAAGRKAVTKDASPYYEGWMPVIGVRNNVELTIAHMQKIQGENTSTWLVDATSRIVVSNSLPASGQSNFYGQIFDVEASEGVQFLGNVSSNGKMVFKLHDEGSVLFKGVSGWGDWTISADLDWGSSTGTETIIKERQLLCWTNYINGVTFGSEAMGGTYSDLEIGPSAITSGVVTASAPVGTYQLVASRQSGVSIKWVAYAPVATEPLIVDTTDGESVPLTVTAETLAALAAQGGVAQSALNDKVANGLRVWENILLGITSAVDTEAEDLTLSIQMVNGSPVVTSPTGALAGTDGLSLDNPTQTITIGSLTATVALQQSDSLGEGVVWKPASNATSPAARFYRISVQFQSK